MRFSVAKDFSTFPAGRTKEDGPHSGEALRKILFERLSAGPVEVDLNGTMGFGSSFLEQAFYGLHWLFPGLLTFVASDSSLVREVSGYAESCDGSPYQVGDEVENTTQHDTLHHIEGVVASVNRNKKAIEIRYTKVTGPKVDTGGFYRVGSVTRSAHSLWKPRGLGSRARSSPHGDRST